jgi:hypothetical protein
MKRILAVIAVFASTGAHAETSFFYGSNGQYQGNAIHSGNSTFYYGRNGEYEGQQITPSQRHSDGGGTSYQFNPHTNNYEYR